MVVVVAGGGGMRVRGGAKLRLAWSFLGRLKHSPVLNTRRRMFHKPANMSDTKTDMDGEGIPNKPASGKLFLFFFPSLDFWLQERVSQLLSNPFK